MSDQVGITLPDGKHTHYCIMDWEFEYGSMAWSIRLWDGVYVYVMQPFRLDEDAECLVKYSSEETQAGRVAREVLKAAGESE